MTANERTVLGGRGDAWCYGALVMGRVVYTEELDVPALEATLASLSAEVGEPLVCVVPSDLADEEAESVLGVPIAVAVLGDDAGNELTVDVPAEALNNAASRAALAELWARVAERTGFEVDGEDALYLAPGGWSQVRLEVGEVTLRAFSENDPPAARVTLEATAPARLTVSAA